MDLSHLDTISTRIYDHYKQTEEQPRPHLGASQMGEPCDRALWLSFRWAINPGFDGRLLKLFKRGHREEPFLIEDLKSIGLDIREYGDSQRRLKFAPHVGGSVDGIIYGGIPKYENKKHVLECKTMSKKNYEKIIKDGLEKTKPGYYIQVQMYMHETKIDRALFVAVCKDDDRVYTERVRYDKTVAEKSIFRAVRIVNYSRLPEMMTGAHPDLFNCKYCFACDFCHKKAVLKKENINCRTCAHSTPTEDNEWTCEQKEFKGYKIPLEKSRIGCSAHTIHPDLVPWPINENLSTETEAAFVIDGEIVLNGEKGKSSKYLLSEFGAQKICDMFNGEIIK